MEAAEERSHILCPVRGAKRSLRTVDHAIDRALAESAELTFLYVVDVDFLGYATVARVNVMLDELRETGQFALLFVSERARQRGVVEVSTLVKEGGLGDAIIEVVGEIGATTLVVGRPLRPPGSTGFSKRDFSQMLDRVREETGIDIEKVE